VFFWGINVPFGRAPKPKMSPMGQHQNQQIALEDVAHM